MNDIKQSNFSNLWLIIIPISMMSVGQSFAKAGADEFAMNGSWINIYVVAAYTLLIMRGLVWIYVLKKIKLVYAYPLMSVTYILILAIAAWLFDESITLSNIVGSVGIIMGVFLLSIGEYRLEKME